MESVRGNATLTRLASLPQESSTDSTLASTPSSRRCQVPHGDAAPMESLHSDSPTRPLPQLRIPECSDDLLSSIDKDETGKLFRVKKSPVTHCVSSVSDYGTIPISLMREEAIGPYRIRSHMVTKHCCTFSNHHGPKPLGWSVVGNWDHPRSWLPRSCLVLERGCLS